MSAAQAYNPEKSRAPDRDAANRFIPGRKS